MLTNRRTFLRTVAAAVSGAAVAPEVLASTPAPRLVFHPQAFALVMLPQRADIFYGWGCVSEHLAARIVQD